MSAPLSSLLYPHRAAVYRDRYFSVKKLVHLHLHDRRNCLARCHIQPEYATVIVKLLLSRSICRVFRVLFSAQRAPCEEHISQCDNDNDGHKRDTDGRRSSASSAAPELDQSAMPIQALMPVSFTAQTQPKISIMPITRQIFDAARQPPKYGSKDADGGVRENIGIKPGIIRMEEPKPTRIPTAITDRWCPT